jgi:hypothetical protein
MESVNICNKQIMIAYDYTHASHATKKHQMKEWGARRERIHSVYACVGETMVLTD